ncbi:MAG: histidine kinase [Cytophagaceae bacterium]|nr:histidine kinase [Cytophagaceae bacterium]MDW8456673.1 histidine kinase [Cytophagaceae bacterium]
MFIDIFIHDTLKENISVLRKARFLVFYSIIGSAMSVCMGIYNLFANEVNTNTILLFTTIFFSTGILYTIKRHGLILFPAIIICVAIWALSVSSAWNSGGIYSMDLHPLFMCIVSAYIFSGRKHALIWLFIVACTFLFFYLLDLFQYRDYEADLKILNPQTQYVKRLFFALNTGILIIFYEYNMTTQTELLEQSKSLEQIRQQLAKDFHDEIGNKLSAIALHTHVVLHKQLTSEEYKKTMEKIGALSRQLYESSRDFIWSIDTKNDELSALYYYIKDFGEEYFELLNIKFYAQHFPHNIPVLKFSNYCNRQIIMIFKEAMTNAARHSQCKKVTFIMSISEKEILFKLIDDGIGFYNIELNKGRGLQNMMHRADNIHAHLEINPMSRAGTEITLILNKQNV